MDEQVELIYALIGRETCSAINIMCFKLHVTELAPYIKKIVVSILHSFLTASQTLKLISR